MRARGLLQVIAAVDVALGARQAIAAVLASVRTRAELATRDALGLATDRGAAAGDGRARTGRCSRRETGCGSKQRDRCDCRGQPTTNIHEDAPQGVARTLDSPTYRAP